jgi:hypothetical protein
VLRRLLALCSGLAAATWLYLWEFVRAWIWESIHHMLSTFLPDIRIDDIAHYGPPSALVILSFFLFWKTRHDKNPLPETAAIAAGGERELPQKLELEPTAAQVPIPAEIRAPEIAVALDGEPVAVGDFKPVCAIVMTNGAGRDLERCLIQITEFLGRKPINMQLPFTLRTREQINSNSRGYFNLFKTQRATVPILVASPHKANEWFFFGEGKERYFSPADSMRLKLAVYGGEEPMSVALSIDVDAGWKPFPHLTVLPTAAEVSAVIIPLRDAAAELYGAIAATNFGRLTSDNCGDSEELIWDAIGSLIVNRGGGWGRRPGSDRREKLSEGALFHARMVGGARIIRTTATEPKTLYTDLSTTRGQLDRITRDLKAVADERSGNVGDGHAS